MNKRVVEPNRKKLDIQKIYRNKHVLKAGGPGGLVCITIVGARWVCFRVLDRVHNRIRTDSVVADLDALFNKHLLKEAETKRA